MMDGNNMRNAEELVGKLNTQKVKYVKKDKGLIERKNKEENIILTEDNRQILFG